MLASCLLHNLPELVALLIFFPLQISFQLYFIYPLKNSVYLLQQSLNVSKMDLSAWSLLFLCNYIAFMLWYWSQNKSSVPCNQNSWASSSSRNSAYWELKLNRLWSDGDQALSQKVIMDRQQMADWGQNKCSRYVPKKKKKKEEEKKKGKTKGRENISIKGK